MNDQHIKRILLSSISEGCYLSEFYLMEFTSTKSISSKSTTNNHEVQGHSQRGEKGAKAVTREKREYTYR